MTTSQSATLAQFERVDEHGDLIFLAHGQYFRVVIDDKLEQGILASKQIREENSEPTATTSRASIPISTIQAMVRAGDDIANIAEHFAISEALVRRFAKPVETEKKYALDQFLVAPAPGSLRHRSVKDVLSASLDTVNIPMSAVQWRTTRQGHNPWQIEATFTLSGQTIRAQWSWNLHDNTVTPLNTTGGRLLRIARTDLDHFEVDGATMTDLFDHAPAASSSQASLHQESGQDSVPTAPLQAPAPRVATSSADSWIYGGSTPSNASTARTVPFGASSTAQQDVQSGANRAPYTAIADTHGSGQDIAQQTHDNSPLVKEAVNTPAGIQSDTATSHTADTSNALNSSATLSPTHGPSVIADVDEPSVLATSAQPLKDTHSASNAASSGNTSENKPRKPRRSAVPSWDEILFGE